MIKIAIDSGPLSDGHAVRGIGVMVREQINALKNLKTKELKRIVIENFDFQNEDGRKKLESGEYDVVHYPYFFPYALTMPEKKQGKRMVVCHKCYKFVVGRCKRALIFLMESVSYALLSTSFKWVVSSVGRAAGF